MELNIREYLYSLSDDDRKLLNYALNAALNKHLSFSSKHYTRYIVSSHVKFNTLSLVNIILRKLKVNHISTTSFWEFVDTNIHF